MAEPEHAVEMIEVDAVSPPTITHHCEEISIDGKLDQIYNYLTYEFMCEGLHVLARTYVDEIRKVAIYGPYTGQGRQTGHVLGSASWPEPVLDYLKRRFAQIDTLGNEGYAALWQAVP
jgi:hypothetical protein